MTEKERTIRKLKVTRFICLWESVMLLWKMLMYCQFENYVIYFILSAMMLGVEIAIMFLINLEIERVIKTDFYEH